MTSANSRRYIAAGFCLIALIYILYNVFFVYVSYYNDIPRRLRHINKLAAVLLVYAVGYYTLKRYDVKWMATIWNLVYFSGIVLLLFVGFYDWSLGPVSSPVRNIAKTMHDFLISPVLYAGLLIINKTMLKMSAAA